MDYASGIIIFGLIFGIIVLGCTRKQYKTYVTVTASMITFVLAILLYYKYLSGDVSFVYTTSDGFAQYLPIYKDYIRMLQEGKGLSFWNFSIGFGAAQSWTKILYPTQLIPILIGVGFGEHAMIIALAWMHVLKMTLATCFMTLFLKKFRLNELTCLYIGVIYAFCSHQIIRGFWWTLGDECYIAVLILWAAECYYREKKWKYIPLAIAVLSMGFGVYYSYLYGLELFVYATLRYFYDKHSIKEYPKFILTCGGLYLLGALMMSIVLLDHTNMLLDTARYVDTQTYSSVVSKFEIVDPKVLVSAVLSIFDVNCSGVFHLYTGALNYLERPMFYCGLACLFLIPQGLLLTDKRTRRFMIGSIGIAEVYMIFPVITDIFNMFVKNEEMQLRSYRMSSLWIAILMILFAAYGLECVLSRKEFHRKGIFLTGVFLIVLLIFCMYKAPVLGINIDYNVCRWVVVFLIGWTLFFITVRWNDQCEWKRIICSLIFLGISVLEMGHSTRTTVNVSAVYADQYYTYMTEDQIGYYSDVSEAVRWLKETDKALYRVSGIRTQTATYCSPLYFGVFDSSYYTNINSGTYMFLKEVYPESFMNNIGTKYSVGVGDDLYLSTLTGYKYLLRASDNPTDVPLGYELIHSVGNIEIYKNKYALSWGLTYDKYIKKSVFQKFTDEQQRKLMIHCVVLEDDVFAELTELTYEDGVNLLSLDESELYLSGVSERQKNGLNIGSWEDDHIVGTVNSQKKKIMYFSIPKVNGWKLYIDYKEQEIIEANMGFMAVELTAGEHRVELIYHPPLFNVSCLFSIAAIMVYVIFVIKDFKMGTKSCDSDVKNKGCKYMEENV